MTDVDEILKKGMAFHGKGQFVEAEACYRQVLKIEPENADAIYLLGLLAEAIGDRNLAIDLIGHAIAIQPANPLFHSALGALLKSQGKQDLAISSYLNALKLDPSHSDSLIGLANLYHETGRREEAISLYRKYLDIKPEDHACRERLNALLSARKITAGESLKQGLQFHLNGQFEEAAECYRNAVKADPDNALSIALLDLSNDALEDVRLIQETQPGIDFKKNEEIESAPETERLISSLKLDLLERKNEIIGLNDRIRVAEAQLQAIAKSSTKWNFAPALQLAESLRTSGKLDEAAGIGEIALKLQPGNKFAIAFMIDLGVIYHQRHDLSRAESIYKLVLEKDAKNPKALHLLGLVYGQRDQYAQSLELIEQSIRHAANVPPHFLTNAGQMAEKLHDPTKAEAYFRQSLDKDINHADAYLCLSSLLENQGKYDEAEQCLLEGMDRLPDNAELANRLQHLNYKARPLAHPENP